MKQGVTKEHVAAAVAQLRQRGERVTNRAVREEVGGGSPQTILKHLNALLGEEAAAEAKVAASPAEAFAAKSGELLKPLIDEALRHARIPLEAEVVRLESELADITAYNEELLGVADAARAEATAATAARAADKEKEAATVELRIVAENRASAAEVRLAQMEVRAVTAEKKAAELEAALAREKANKV